MEYLFALERLIVDVFIEDDFHGNRFLFPREKSEFRISRKL